MRVFAVSKGCEATAPNVPPAMPARMRDVKGAVPCMGTVSVVHDGGYEGCDGHEGREGGYALRQHVGATLILQHGAHPGALLIWLSPQWWRWKRVAIVEPGQPKVTSSHRCVANIPHQGSWGERASEARTRSSNIPRSTGNSPK